MSYLVTGGAGFLGSHLVDRLIQDGADKVVVVDNFFLGSMENLWDACESGRIIVYREDCRFLTSLETILEREKPSLVFDCAVKPLPYSFTDPDGAYMVSVEISRNLAHLLKKGSYDRLIHISSSEAYGTAKLVPMDEKHPLDPVYPYGAGKAAADLLLLSYAKTFKLPIIIPRPFNIYGPRQNTLAYAAVIPITIRRILDKQDPVIEWDGEQTRDFTYVSDIVDGILKLSRCDAAMREVINLGQGGETKIKDVVHTICKLMDHRSVQHAPQRPDDVRRHCSNISKAKHLVGYKPRVQLRDGIRTTVQWYQRRFAAHEPK